MGEEVKREPWDMGDCCRPVVESPSSTPTGTRALALPSYANGHSTLTAAGFTSVMFERRERALYTSGSSSKHLNCTAPIDLTGPDEQNIDGQQAGGSGGAHVSTAQSTNITAPGGLGAQEKRARGQRYKLKKTHTHWWLEYTCERGRFRFKKPKKRSLNEPIRYKCAKCKWIIDIFTSNNECFTETDPAGNVDFGGAKPHSVACICDEHAAQDGQQIHQAAPNNNAERDGDEVQVCGTRNNRGVVRGNRDTMAVPYWVQNSPVLEEITRTYYRSTKDYLAIKKAQNVKN